jgi:hypothetical protein
MTRRLTVRFETLPPRATPPDRTALTRVFGGCGLVGTACDPTGYAGGGCCHECLPIYTSFGMHYYCSNGSGGMTQ